MALAVLILMGALLAALVSLLLVAAVDPGWILLGFVALLCVVTWVGGRVRSRG